MKGPIKEGDNVVLMKSFNADNIKIIAVEPGKIIHYGKLHFDPSPLIGAEYGSIFEISEETMTKVDDFESYDNELSTEVSSKLANFNGKSQFSQEKILKKKKKKNGSNIVTVIRPSLLLINEMFYARDKVGGLRSDSLSQILTSSNIQNGSRCLLYDHNLGLLTAGVMSRILPDGTCVQLAPNYEHVTCTRRTLSMLNIKEKDFGGKIFGLTMKDLYKIHLKIDQFSYEDDIMRARGVEHLDRIADLPHKRTMRDSEGDKITTAPGASRDDDQEQGTLQQTLIKNHANRELRNEERLKAASILKSRSLNTIILIAQNDHPLPILKLCYDFLLLSGQFVIYCDTIEPLLECHDYLRSNSLAVSMNLSESWLRRYQVLPDRSRPEMNMSGFGGYLLSGTKALYGPNVSELIGNHGFDLT